MVQIKPSSRVSRRSGAPEIGFQVSRLRLAGAGFHPIDSSSAQTSPKPKKHKIANFFEGDPTVDPPLVVRSTLIGVRMTIFDFRLLIVEVQTTAHSPQSTKHCAAQHRRCYKTPITDHRFAFGHAVGGCAGGFQVRKCSLCILGTPSTFHPQG